MTPNSVMVCSMKQVRLVLTALVSLVVIISGQAQMQAQTKTSSLAGVDPAVYAETHKSAYQKRKEANERLLGTPQGKEQQEAAAAAASKSAKAGGTPALKQAALVKTVTPSGVNPAVDVTIPNFANSPNIRKFVDSLPGAGPTNANNLGQYLPIGVPDPNAYPGSDYYEVALIRYSKKLSSDLPPTDLRGYVQLETAANATSSSHIALTYPGVAHTPIRDIHGAQVYAFAPPQYLGPVIVAQKDRPVRVKFTNYLPLGAAGDLPLPVDTTIMGAGMGPEGMNVTTGTSMNYTQNRGTLHLHGGTSPWISDGTTHQWVTPAGEATDYTKGVGVFSAPDMPDPGPGSINFYWTNGQSGRMMFYHDHAYGITRLNVYAGEAAGYFITDPVEQDLINGTNRSGGNPGLLSLPTLGGAYPLGVPLVIQDKTFVNTAATTAGLGFAGTPTPLTAVTDPLWFTHLPTSVGGNLWLPHEYMPNENPYNTTGYNDMGRWDYAPWMIPPLPVTYNTIPSPTLIPEAYGDTAMVNGTAFPYVNLPPTLVRFRVLNACNDRMLNLQLYKADPAYPTEVKMVPAAPTAGFPAGWPTDGRDGGVPDPATSGPAFWQIGNEAGLLAQVNVIPQAPVNYDYSRRSVTFGGVTNKTLLLPPAVRADVLVDLSKYVPGDTLILYNDGPAPMPLYDTRNDYYTGDPDQTSNGGAPPTPAGFGPNTRTVMQIRITTPTVALPPVSATYLTSLTTAIPKAYAVDQDPPIVPESPFNAAYGTSYPDNFQNAIDQSMNVSGTPQGVEKIVTTFVGLNYTSPPTVTLVGGGGTSATAVATLNGVNDIAVLTQGAGYTSPPTVTITAAPGDTGSGATAEATISGGVVIAFNVTNMGSNYLVAPTVTVTGGGATTQATGAATITIGSVGAINVTNPGSGYTKAPYVLLEGGGGQGINAATAAAMLVGDWVPTTKNLVEGFDMDYGRMNAQLGSTPSFLTPTIGAGATLGLSQYIDPPTEIVSTEVPYLWRITHIGVDSHAIHFHLFDVQVINRVDWTNTLKAPYPEEYGWKDTIRTNPFEDIIIALRPRVSKMKLPFGLPESIRLLDVTNPAGSTMGFSPAGPPPGLPQIAQITNVVTNFGWEYVWHCHLLGHEENDMMRPTVCIVPTVVPAASVLSGGLTANVVNLTWTDPTPWNGFGPASTQGNPANEIGYQIQRSANGTAYTTIGTAPANTTKFADSTTALGNIYRYQVVAYNAAGNTNSNALTVSRAVAPGAPTSVIATVAGSTQVSVIVIAGTTGGSPITQFNVTANKISSPAAPPITVSGPTSPVLVTGLTFGATYTFTATATNAVGTGPRSAPSNSVSLAGPAAPTNLVATVSALSLNPPTVGLTWNDNSNNETQFIIQRATNQNFSRNLTTFSVGPNVKTYTDTSVAQNTLYYYRVQASNPIGASTYAVSLPVTTAGQLPAAPTNLTVLSWTRNSATMSWTDNATNEQGFYLWRSTTGSTGPWTRINVARGTAPPPSTVRYTNSGLRRGTQYWYQLQSYNAFGTSAMTPVVNGSTLP